MYLLSYNHKIERNIPSVMDATERKQYVQYNGLMRNIVVRIKHCSWMMYE